MTRIFIVLACLLATRADGDKDWVAAFQERLSALRAQKEPVTTQEVLAHLEIPSEASGAAREFLKAFELLEKPEAQMKAAAAHEALRSDFPLGDPLPAQVRAPMEEYVAQVRGALDLIYGALELPPGRYPSDCPLPEDPPVDFTTVADSGLPFGGGLRDALRLCPMDAILCAQAADKQGAMRALLAIRRLIAPLKNNPSAEAALLQFAGAILLADTAERVLSLCELPGDSLKKLAAEVDVQLGEMTLEPALLGERARGYWLVTTWADKHMALMLSFMHPAGEVNADLRQLAAQQGVEILDYFAKAKRALGLPWPQRIAAAISLDDLVTQKVHANETVLLLDAVALCLGKMVSTMAKAQAALTAMRIGLAAERWRLSHGEFPDTLSALVPEGIAALPDDPYSGAPLTYIQTSGTAVVLSVVPGWQPGSVDWQDRGDLRAKAARSAEAFALIEARSRAAPH
jgi:hypothetical protein